MNFLLVRGTLRNLFPKIYHKIYTSLLTKFLKEHNIQIALVQYGPMGATWVDACELANVPMVVHFHGADAYHYDTVKKYTPAYKKLFKQAKALIAVSRDMKQQLIILGADSEKVHYNPCSVNLDIFKGAAPEKAPVIFIAVGRFSDKKGPEFTIKAFARVIQICPEAKLIMIGIGDLLEKSKHLARNLGVESAIEFKGALLSKQIINILQTGRAFVQHSKRADNGDSEGTPVSILEASATGLPIVSTLHAGIKDAVAHGETGFLVPEGDVEGMAKYMIQLAQDPALAGEMGRKGREFMQQNFAMPDRIKRLKEILASVV
ncbi:MAG: glycosyltransferase [Bacteroidota bacterium]